MKILSKQLTNSLMLKGIASILAILIWLKITHNQHIEWETDIPLFFYNSDESILKQIPEQVTARLRGTRKNIYLSTQDEYAIHVDGQNLKPGLNTVNLTTAIAHLPDSVKLLDYSPSHINIYLENNL